jgi:hypothetical protein
MPEAGRFTNFDPHPLGIYGITNPFGYAAGNPIYYKDSNGLWLETGLDVLGTLADAYEFGNDIVEGNYVAALGSGGWLLLDFVGVALPVVPAPGVIRHADDILDAGKDIEKFRSCKKPLRKRMEPPPPELKNPQAHHDLPVKHEKIFERKGLDINDPENGRWVEGGPEGNHQKWSYDYNEEWKKYLADNPTPEQIMQKMYEMRNNPKYK